MGYSLWSHRVRCDLATKTTTYDLLEVKKDGEKDQLIFFICIQHIEKK